ncbi:hypothetical protein [Kordia sp.]|uniref:hypothetical protein n=1 Tax=Kordia sp. TaxID=1965332 RepID=UPI003D6A80AD
MKKQFGKLELKKKSIVDLNTLKTTVGGNGLTNPERECKTTPVWCKVKTEIGCPKPPVIKSLGC